MHCPFCQYQETKVTDSRLVGEGDQVRRRRECLSCSERFTTFETIELALPRVIKRDGSRSQFSEEKISKGFLKALEKRSVSTEAIAQAVRKILHLARGAGEREISSALIGEWVMEELFTLDQVAYVRFASVYRSFEDLDAFRSEIQRLKQKLKQQQHAISYEE